ncbi:LmbU family transcriptional regulator [Actinocorallia sp. B10E7]|uniref:LmbU family transcriptional regulator n=1 Tax=Actinocorallia sp. B10E7 TaxID=3153558 RepID=UPI00325F01B1
MFGNAVPLEDWLAIGRQIAAVADASAWWLGDWLVYGQDRFPERYAQAVKASGLCYKTLRNYAWISRKFPVSRRRDTLTIQHHAAVAALSPAEQDRWLNEAERSGLSVAALRRRLRAEHASGDGRGENARVVIQVDPGRIERWRAAAKAISVDLSDWVPSVLDRAADSSAGGRVLSS